MKDIKLMSLEELFQLQRDLGKEIEKRMKQSQGMVLSRRKKQLTGPNIFG